MKAVVGFVAILLLLFYISFIKPVFVCADENAPPIPTTETVVNSPTPTPTLTPTLTPMLTPTPTNTPISTQTPTPSPTSTPVPSSSSVNTPTSTPIPTKAPTPVPIVNALTPGPSVTPALGLPSSAVLGENAGGNLDILSPESNLISDQTKKPDTVFQNFSVVLGVVLVVVCGILTFRVIKKGELVQNEEE